MGKQFNHYFTNDNLEHKEHFITEDFFGQTYKFKSQDGVFSKSKLDDGTLFLLKTVIEMEHPTGAGLDLGCGYGTITVILSKNCDVQMTACDVNERAVALTKDNIALNGISANVVVSDVAKAIEKCDYDFVITNPPIRVGNAILFQFFEESHQKLRDNGAFYAVLRKKQGAETYIKKIASIYGNCEVLDKHKGYVICKAIKEKEKL